MEQIRCLLVSLLLLTWAHAQEIRTGEAALAAMHHRYRDTWYKTLTFTQESTTYNADGTTKVDTWHEALLLPGKLRVDVGDPSANNGMLLVDGTLTGFRNGKPSHTRPFINMLLLLGFDVYRQAPETTIEMVKGEGIDLSKFHEDTWNGKPAYVVGAEKGDLQSKQFWIEKERLLFVRLIDPDQAGAKKLQDIRFANYGQANGGWVAARVELYEDDKLVFSEDYSDIRSDVKLDPAVFDSRQFASTHWEK